MSPLAAVRRSNSSKGKYCRAWRPSTIGAADARTGLRGQLEDEPRPPGHTFLSRTLSLALSRAGGPNGDHLSAGCLARGGALRADDSLGHPAWRAECLLGRERSV